MWQLRRRLARLDIAPGHPLYLYQKLKMFRPLRHMVFMVLLPAFPDVGGIVADLAWRRRLDRGHSENLHPESSNCYHPDSLF